MPTIGGKVNLENIAVFENPASVFDGYQLKLTPLKAVERAPIEPGQNVTFQLDEIGGYTVTLIEEAREASAEVFSNLSLQCQPDYEQIGTK